MHLNYCTILQNVTMCVKDRLTYASENTFLLCGITTLLKLLFRFRSLVTKNGFLLKNLILIQIPKLSLPLKRDLSKEQNIFPQNLLFCDVQKCNGRNHRQYSIYGPKCILYNHTAIMKQYKHGYVTKIAFRNTQNKIFFIEINHTNFDFL